mgnify:CR=1 FL=1
MKKQELFNTQQENSPTNDSLDKWACMTRHMNTMPAGLVCW